MAVNGIGRPLIYDPEYHPKEARRLASEGLIDAEIANAFNISVATISDWKKRFPEFLESLKKGKAVIDNKVVNCLYNRAIGFTGPDDKYYPPDVTAQIYWTKNRMPQEWRDKQQTEISGPDGAPLTLNLIRTDFKQKSDD